MKSMSLGNSFDKTNPGGQQTTMPFQTCDESPRGSFVHRPSQALHESIGTHVHLTYTTPLRTG